MKVAQVKWPNVKFRAELLTEYPNGDWHARVLEETPRVHRGGVCDLKKSEIVSIEDVSDAMVP